ncbi:unnamed protein product [Ceratitis capitata]|uniref:(Mediterranean fruit fly) hypothetical protein n=1 Tax=Ceratitis capitata TaxID=7213 RepID=A0A811UXT7_CERCA|nr:unnamed protein product [Ceratitis capitata]
MNFSAPDLTLLYYIASKLFWLLLPQNRNYLPRYKVLVSNHAHMLAHIYVCAHANVINFGAGHTWVTWQSQWQQGSSAMVWYGSSRVAIILESSATCLIPSCPSFLQKRTSLRK